MQRQIRLAAALAMLVMPVVGRAQERGAAALGQAVDALGMRARVLVVAAHPDDEDTRLITWLAKGRHAETAYLSLTRGDGGQNLIGNELGEALGAIRTEELLAARRIDGGRQFFARAFDFGFSKTAEETFQHWPHDSVLGDVVKIVRAYRPDVMIAIWSGTPADGHGHHQASGIIAREAYDASGDTVRFPTATYGAPWAVPKFYRSTSYRNNQGSTFRVNAGAYDPLLGRSYAEIAAASRSQHKSQGQGGIERPGVSIVSLRREATRVNESTPAEREGDLFAGIDTTWTAVAMASPGASRARADSLAAAITAVQRAFDARHPDALLAPLLPLQRLAYGLIDEHAPSAVAMPLLARVAAIASEAAGVTMTAEAPRDLVAIGDTIPVTVTIYNHGRQAATARVVDPANGRADTLRVLPDSSAARRYVITAAAPTTATDSALWRAGRPWWLARPRVGDMFTVPVATNGEEVQSVGRPLFATAFVGGIAVDLGAPITHHFADAVRGDVKRPLASAPVVSVTLDHALEYARAGVPLVRELRVRLRSAATTKRDVTVRVELPAGLTADTAMRRVTLPAYDARAELTFRLRGTLTAGAHPVHVVAESDGERFTEGYEPIEYDHIRPLRLYRPSDLTLQAVDVALPPKASIAYVQGVGDNVAPALAQLGLNVTMLQPSAIASTDLSRFTAVVIGQRAYDANDALLAQNARLLVWVRGGGTMVVQGGQYEMMQPGVMPYPVTIGRPTLRVTHPEAPVTVLDTTTSVLASPNRITARDFAGWVQERARYMPEKFDVAYHGVLSMQDPGETPNLGALLVAPYGKGTYVYTTLSLFRQLPAGNAGAARLFVNLLAAKARAAAVQ